MTFSLATYLADILTDLPLHVQSDTQWYTQQDIHSDTQQDTQTDTHPGIHANARGHIVPSRGIVYHLGRDFYGLTLLLSPSYEGHHSHFL